jgi:hypothetical protein
VLIRVKSKCIWLLFVSLPLLPYLFLLGSIKTGVGEDAGKKEPSYTVGGNVD